MGREEQIINQRKRKIKELKAKGVSSYPTKFDKKNNIEECRKSKLKSKVKTAGRIMTQRDLGKIAFAKLQDFTGTIQLILQQKETHDKEREFFKKYIDIGDIIGVEGVIIKSKTGELSILVKKIELLTKSIKPLPEKWHGLKEKEDRYRKRYLDLTMNPKIKEVFDKRAKVISAIREFLTKKGYIEVETPILQPIYGGTSARPFKSKLNALDMTVYMRISNEMYLKRLIGGGYEKIFEFSRDFRNEGIDSTHNPEFTLMETMCAYADYKQNMDLVEEMLEFVCKKVTGETKIEYQGKKIDFKRPWKRISMVEAIKKYGKLDVEKMYDDELKKKLKELGIKPPVFKRGIAMEELFGFLVENKLIQPTIVYDYPFETCGLAKPKKDNPKFAERFEPYINGWELGNIYSELNDPEVLENYWKEQEKMLSKDAEVQRLDKDFLNMLKIGMPPTSGVGIGIDRLIMLLTNQPSIRDVLLFPFMKPEGYKELKEGKAKSSKIAIAIINKGQKMKAWEEMNTIAHLNAAFAARIGRELLMQDTVETKDNEEIKLNIQHAIMIKKANSNKEILDLIKNAKKWELDISEFTREMIETTDDKKVSEWTKKKKLKDIDYLGVLIFGKKTIVEKLTEKFKLCS